MDKPKLINLGFAITGSFCTHEKILVCISSLVLKGFNVIPILSEVTATLNTRFGESADFIEKLSSITGNKPVTTIIEAEPLGPKNKLDVLIIAPCTGNTLSKLANAITDGTVLMTAKSHMRNNKPLVVGISSNDALGLNLQNIAKLITTKNVYFVPFGQDDYVSKPKSLICDWSLIEKTVLHALDGKQIQPILLQNK